MVNKLVTTWPNINIFDSFGNNVLKIQFFDSVAQLVNLPVYWSGGCEFKPRQGQNLKTEGQPSLTLPWCEMVEVLLKALEATWVHMSWGGALLCCRHNLHWEDHGWNTFAKHISTSTKCRMLCFASLFWWKLRTCNLSETVQWMIVIWFIYKQELAKNGHIIRIWLITWLNITIFCSLGVQKLKFSI